MLFFLSNEYVTLEKTSDFPLQYNKGNIVNSILAVPQEVNLNFANTNVIL